MSEMSFKYALETGRQVLVLRDVGLCDCLTGEPTEYAEVSELDVLSSSMFDNLVDKTETADPDCPHCMGTGKKFFRILSTKIRTTDVNAVKEGTSATELQVHKLIKDDNVFFYFDDFYKFLTLKDHVAVLEHDKDNNLILPIKVTDVFKIVDRIEFYDGDFVYYRMTGSKKKEA